MSPDPHLVPMGWGRRLVEDARKEWQPATRRVTQCLRRVDTRVTGSCFWWLKDAEPSLHPDQRLLAEDDHGYILMPAGLRDGEPWWQGRWRWWNPRHWPAWIRSFAAKSYVLVEHP